MTFPSKQAKTTLDDSEIAVDVTAFSDKICVMVWTDGRIGKMLTVGLRPSSTAHLQIDESGSQNLTPLPYLTPVSLIGSSSDQDISGRMYASMIASVIARQAPSEGRTVVIGLGPQLGPKPGDDSELTDGHRAQLAEVVRLVQQCRVW